MSTKMVWESIGTLKSTPAKMEELMKLVSKPMEQSDTSKTYSGTQYFKMLQLHEEVQDELKQASNAWRDFKNEYIV